MLLNPESMFALSNLNFLSKDSRCFSFDHRANGYSRGEGCGIVVIKLLADALRDGDTIRAVIRATGTNQDGKTSVLTQPSSTTQENLIHDTYRAGGIDITETKYFESHGTGTSVGDLMEANAIMAAFKHQQSRETPLYVGAVKSNIGHLEGASGVAGLIKTILILERALIPPNTNFERLNPRLSRINSYSIKVSSNVQPESGPPVDVWCSSLSKPYHGRLKGYVEPRSILLVSVAPTSMLFSMTRTIISDLEV